MLLSISKFLQQLTWPRKLCKADIPCRRPNDWHRPDIAILMMESNKSIPDPPPTPPASDHGLDPGDLEMPLAPEDDDEEIPIPRRITSPRLVGLPIILFKVEGSKDVWGRNEQEVKAMHEVTSSLAMLPVVYLIFVYPREIKIWEVCRNPADACISVQEEIIILSKKGKGVSTCFWKLVIKIVCMMIKQITTYGSVVEASMKYMRANKLHECARPVINLCMEDEICDGCYHLDSIARALNLLCHHQYNLFSQTWDHPVPESVLKKDAHGWGHRARQHNGEEEDTNMVTE